MTAAHTCSRIIAGNTPKWQVYPAPDPRDVFWKNHSPNVGSFQRTLWFLVGIAMEFFLILFWIFPTTFAAGLSNLEAIKYYPELAWLQPFVVWLENHHLRTFVEGFLPQVVILFFFLILLPFIRIIVNMTTIPLNRTEKIHSIIIIYFTFKIVNIYCTGLLTASFFKIFDQLRAIIEQPITLLQLLGAVVPTQVLFFLNFVTTSALRESMLRLWRPWSLVSELFSLYCCAVTPRDFKRIYKPEVFEYYEAYPDKAFILVIVLCYSNISPLILIFGNLYFMLMYITETYRLLYVCKSKSPAFGMLWSTAFNQACAGLILYHLTMIGVFVLNQFLYGAIIALLMLLFVVYFTYFMNTRWYPIAYYGSMESLTEKDEIVPATSSIFKKENVYCHPSLLPIPRKKREDFGENEPESEDDLEFEMTEGSEKDIDVDDVMEDNWSSNKKRRASPLGNQIPFNTLESPRYHKQEASFSSFDAVKKY
uniref:CSC1/OSCA1-like 7TM region domain-containing protein n=1 Tax=Arcella intermedia TaxID=1963864 RepID=A0A6B2L2P2_9EUKA